MNYPVLGLIIVAEKTFYIILSRCQYKTALAYLINEKGAYTG